MGIVGDVLLSFIFSIAYMGSPALQQHLPKNIATPSYLAPARKSVIIDREGLAHPTADLTQMTRRDRSQIRKEAVVAEPAPVVVEETPAPTVEVVQQTNDSALPAPTMESAADAQGVSAPVAEVAQPAVTVPAVETPTAPETVSSVSTDASTLK